VPSETIGVIAERYATALFELAEGQGSLDLVAGDLKALKSMIRESADLATLLDSPVLTRAEQAKAMAALAQAAQFGVLTANFLGLVAKNRRLHAVVGMINAYLARLAAKRGELSAKISSAVPLSPAQQEALTSTLQSIYNSPVAVEMAVEPALLGGMVVQVGSRMVDSSLRTKLQHLKLAMKGVG
jgi:F-type H+-transporting ATPase subunit delta